MTRLLFILILAGSALGYAAQGAKQTQAYPLFLLRHPSVRKDLAITPAVSAKLDKIKREADARYLALISPSPGKPGSLNRPDQKVIDAELRRRDREMAALLSKSQRQRLTQIGYQYTGGFSVLAPEVAAELKITSEQKRKLEGAFRIVIAASREETRNLVKPGSITGSNPGSTATKLANSRLRMIKSLDKELAIILSQAQRAKWKTLQGKPFPIATLYGPPIKSRRKL